MALDFVSGFLLPLWGCLCCTHFMKSVLAANKDGYNPRKQESAVMFRGLVYDSSIPT